MKPKRLPIGIDSFEEMRKDNWYYVDKSLFIKDLLDFKGKVNLFTRPRRFGKTLNVTMLQCFFEKEPKDSRGNPLTHKPLFEGLAIMDAGEEYLMHQEKYPLISLTLKSGKQPDFHTALYHIKDQIIDEFSRHKYVLEGDFISKLEKGKYLSIMNKTCDEATYGSSLQFLSTCLEKHYQEKVMILIDEYDVPLENAYFKGFYDNMMDFIRSLFESAFKSNAALAFAVITGCLRISKESIFTGLNNLKSVSVLNTSYAEHFGFVQQEVDEMLSFYGLSVKRDVIRRWYDGYQFGNAEVYNPWSVINYIDDLCRNIDAFPKPHWANTSGNNIVRNLVKNADKETKNEIEILMLGGTIEKPIYEDITYEDIDKNTDNLWNFLFFTGYLKKVLERQECDMSYMTMKIPNIEVSYIYKNQIVGWFSDQIKKKDRSKLFTAIMNGDTTVFEMELSDLLANSISYMDNHENFYHGFVVGALSGIPGGYLVKSNRESGNGRSDIIILSKDYNKAVILELKVSKTKKELYRYCDAALLQIKDKCYIRELEEDYDEILCYGLAFWKKKCAVKMDK